MLTGYPTDTEMHGSIIPIPVRLSKFDVPSGYTHFLDSCVPEVGTGTTSGKAYPYERAFRTSLLRLNPTAGDGRLWV